MVQDGYENAAEKPLRMSGPAHAIQKARKLVSELIQSQDRASYQAGFGGAPRNQGPFEHTTNIPVGKECVGFVIGKGGETIKRLKAETGAEVQFNSVDPNQAGDRYLIVQGTKAQCDDVEERVKDILSKAANRAHFNNNRFQ